VAVFCPKAKPPQSFAAQARWRPGQRKKIASDPALGKAVIRSESAGGRPTDPPLLTVADKTVRGRIVCFGDPDNPSCATSPGARVQPDSMERRQRGRITRRNLLKPPGYMAGHRYPLVIQNPWFSCREMSLFAFRRDPPPVLRARENGRPPAWWSCRWGWKPQALSAPSKRARIRWKLFASLNRQAHTRRGLIDPKQGGPDRLEAAPSYHTYAVLAGRPAEARGGIRDRRRQTMATGSSCCRSMQASGQSRDRGPDQSQEDLRCGALLARDSKAGSSIHLFFNSQQG